MQNSLRTDALRYVGYPTAFFAAALLLLYATNADLLLADAIYALGDERWEFRDAWLTNALIHDGGRTLVGLIAVALLAAIVTSLFHRPLARWRSSLLFVFYSALLGAALVNVLKEVTQVDCPWDLARYGGTNIHVPLFGARLPWQEPGRCFPAGHASAGYCWLGVFFVAHRMAPRWQWPALLAPMLLGLVFGIAQQWRGAHFLSHDLWSLYVCWLSSALLYLLTFRQRMAKF